MKKYLCIIVILIFVLVICIPVFAKASGVEFTFSDHESKPHVPSPWRQADVAAGVALSTIGIAAANALTKTTTFGSTSFNGTFDPTSAGSGTSAASGTSAVSGAAGATGSAAASAGTSSAAGSAGGFAGTAKEFFRGLFDSLRDMLADEGRSYAGGKISESLGGAGIDIDIDDTGNGD